LDTFPHQPSLQTIKQNSKPSKPSKSSNFAAVTDCFFTFFSRLALTSPTTIERGSLRIKQRILNHIFNSNKEVPSAWLAVGVATWMLGRIHSHLMPFWMCVSLTHQSTASFQLSALKVEILYAIEVPLLPSNQPSTTVVAHTFCSQSLSHFFQQWI
jgi:hypothetical protein